MFAYDGILTSDLPDVFDNYIHTINNAYNSRTNPLNVFIPKVNNSATYRSVKIASSYIWNLLPSEIRATNYSRNVFNSKVKSWLISKYNDNIE